MWLDLLIKTWKSDFEKVNLILFFIWCQIKLIILNFPSTSIYHALWGQSKFSNGVKKI
jgi:hypothetical protein